MSMNVIGKCSWHVSSVIPIIVTLSRHNFTTTSTSKLFKTRSTLSENEFCRSSKVFRVVFTRFGTEILPKQSASIPARARALTTQDQDEREPEGAEKWRISDCHQPRMPNGKIKTKQTTTIVKYQSCFFCTEMANKDGTWLREISSCCCLTTAGKTR